MNAVNNVGAGALTQLQQKQQDRIEESQRSKAAEKVREDASERPRGDAYSAPVDKVEISPRARSLAAGMSANAAERQSTAQPAASAVELKAPRIQPASPEMAELRQSSGSASQPLTPQADQAASPQASRMDASKSQPAASRSEAPTVSTAEAENSSESDLTALTKRELLDLVLNGDISRSEMNKELDRRDDAEQAAVSAILISGEYSK